MSILTRKMSGFKYLYPLSTFQFYTEPPDHQPAVLGVPDAPDPAGLDVD